MPFHDPVPELMQLGYTPREAAFLFVVGTCSGFFLARQYARFVQRRPGALIQQLIEKGRAHGLMAVLDCGQRRHIYHLNSRTIYRLIGDDDSQNRRIKGDQEIKAKLMILDYILDHLGQRFVCSPWEKEAFFREALRLSKASLLPEDPPNLFDAQSPIQRLFQDRFPIFISETSDPKCPKLTFTYFDPGTATVKPFVRQLRAYQPLFEALRQFQMEYVALSLRNFAAAEEAFHRMFPSEETPSEILPFGRDHLVRFMTTQDMVDRNDRRFGDRDMVILSEGYRVYRRPEHERLYAVWQRSKKEFAAELVKMCGKERTDGRLSLHVLQESYPLFGHRYSGKPIGNIREAQLNAISGLRSSVG